ncbi:MAG: class I SAM-dependent methyltransferase [Caulobacteraceae bacterium]
MAEDAGGPNAQQAADWNDAVGRSWADLHEQIDRQIAPLGRQAMAALEPLAGLRVLDVGCGCGETTRELASRIGAGGEAVGVDVSAMLLAIARDTAPPPGAATLRFIQADAQAAPLGGGFDAAFSRFGVMFFEDPAAAFANIRSALKRGGRLAFVCWRPPAQNPYLTAAMAAARDLLPPAPPPVPHAPGPFGLADGERTRSILAGAGFADVAVKPFDLPIGGDPLEPTVGQALRMGPLASALREAGADEALKARVEDAVRAAYRAFDGADGIVRLPAGVWIVTARNP